MERLKLTWHRLTHWEYWPLWAVYYPLFPVWLYFSIKARSFFFFNTANPMMKNGGMAMESKKDIYEMISDRYIPKTILIEKGNTATKMLDRVKEASISFPLIAKPDIGMKAFGVAKVYDEQGLSAYLKQSPEDFLVQELIEYPKEVGIFYVRHPDEPKGRITGIVSKEFLAVVGDGFATIEQLIKRNPRSHLQLKALRKRFGKKLHSVLGEGEQFILVPFGSHTRGAKFIDYSHRINPDLVEVIDTICTQIPEFHYGRLDVLYRSFDELSAGKHFSVIEINGAGGEATHIYDPKHSLFFAWKEITRHWNQLNLISIKNHRRGFSYLSFKDGRAMLRENGALEEQLKLV